MTNYSRNERQTPYTGAPMDEFSKLMYSYKDRASDGFVFIDIDGILRNHKKQSIAIIEVKTRCGNMTYAQEKTFSEIGHFMERGICCGWVYIGFFKIVFENTSFENGRCWVNNNELTKSEFLDFLDMYF